MKPLERLTPDQRPILRIVRMHFREECVANFVDAFDDIQPQVAAVPGCLGVMLLRDAADVSAVSTLSLWANAEALDAYRKSALFGEIWPNTKAQFKAPAAAESYFWNPSLGFPS